MMPNQCIEVQTSPEGRASIPQWFAEVVLLTQYLRANGLLQAVEQQVRLVRGRFGSYEPLDFLALLLGYAISEERTLTDFFERAAPFGSAFAALFGRARLPHRSSLSRFLAAVDRPCVESLRHLFQQHGLAAGWSAETIGGLWDRQGRRYLVFDVDATRQAARQRALPCGPAFPLPKRRLDAVCAPGYCGRKRGEVVRTRTTVLQMHTRQWVGTYSGKGNGDYRGELTLALHAIASYLQHFACTPDMAVVRLDGLYGDAAVIAQVMLAGMAFVTRGRGYQLLRHPQIHQVLAQAPTACVTTLNTGEVVELFDGGWLAVGGDLPLARVIVARHHAPPPGRPVKVGKRVGAWVYELFLTNLAADGFLVEDLVDLYHGRGAFEGVLADEDEREDPDRWCSYTEAGQELWQIVCQWVWNLRLTLGQHLHEQPLREMELAPSTAPPTSAPVPYRYGPWQVGSGEAEESVAGRSFQWQKDGTLRCPAGTTLWLTHLAQENGVTQRAVYAADLADCQGCPLRAPCLSHDANGTGPRHLTAVRHLESAPVAPAPRSDRLESIRWSDVAGRSLRRTWVVHWQRQAVEVIPLVSSQESASLPPRAARALRVHRRLAWHERQAHNAWAGPPAFRVLVPGVPEGLLSSTRSKALLHHKPPGDLPKGVGQPEPPRACYRVVWREQDVIAEASLVPVPEEPTRGWVLETRCACAAGPGKLGKRQQAIADRSCTRLRQELSQALPAAGWLVIGRLGDPRRAVWGHANQLWGRGQGSQSQGLPAPAVVVSAERHVGQRKRPALHSRNPQTPDRGGSPQEQQSKVYAVYGNKKAREEAVRNGSPPLYTRTVQASTITFRCTLCGVETQAVRYPGPQSLYCGRCAAVVRKEQTRARVKKFRQNQQAQRAAGKHAG
jgi:hypothetical protein